MHLPKRLLASAVVFHLSVLAAQANETPTPPEPPPRIDASQPATLESFTPASQDIGDLDHLPKIFKAYRDKDPAEAQILKSKLSQPAANALAEWFAIRSGAPIGFERVMAFQQDYPAWPVTARIRRSAEDSLLAVSRPPSEIRAFFAKQRPMTGAGRIALAFALKAEGLETKANEQIRLAWREDTLDSAAEKRILENFPGVLKEADHRFRMERHLLRKSWGGAERAAGHAGKDYPSLVKARMAVSQGKKKAEKAFAGVPAALRKDPSYLFSRALFLRRNGKLADAAAAIMQAPRDPELRVDGDAWWAEQRLIARTLLDKGEARAAYDVASHHAAESPAQQIEAEFHAGWIALSFLNEAKIAAGHFAAAAKTASTPISVSRAAYWQGRAAEAAGAAEDAKLFYERAADKPTTYYGQLAQAKLGRIVPLRTAAPLSDAEREAFEALVPVQALRLLHQTGENDLALGLYFELAQTLDDPGQLDALASLAAAQQNARAALAVGKIASQRGFPLDQHAYPLKAIPDFDPVGAEVELAMIYAIARQESAFNPRAVSSAGARGLMQLMPATAKMTAKRFGVGFDLKRLIDDPSYNAKLGSAHLGELMEDWKGSHILAFASYNAGSGNVKKWIGAYGDPRKPQVDDVDWVERIPFYETRNYVQRVMENLHVYRQRLNDRSVPGSASASADAAWTEY